MFVSDNMISALIGALVGAAATWWAGVSASRWSRTLDMHREFNTDRMSESRSKALTFMMVHWGLDFDEIAKRRELSAESLPLWDVMRFYQRLSVTVRHNQVIRRIVPGLFGEIFLWWYLVCFRQQLIGVNWVAADDIEYLYKFMKRKIDRKSWKEWSERHEKEFVRLHRECNPALSLATEANSGDQGGCTAPLGATEHFRNCGAAPHHGLWKKLYDWLKSNAVARSLLRLFRRIPRYRNASHKDQH